MILYNSYVQAKGCSCIPRKNKHILIHINLSEDSGKVQSSIKEALKNNLFCINCNT